MGNHDWGPRADPSAYLDYFNLPGNERYYDYIKGDLHFFVLSSDTRDPDGTSSISIQANWLRTKLQASTAKYKIVYFHHAPYSSGTHGNHLYMRWPFKAWGADLILSGHDHTYERLVIDGLTYVVNGLGGESKYGIRNPRELGSIIGYDDEYGALFAEVKSDGVHFHFKDFAENIIDEFVISAK